MLYIVNMLNLNKEVMVLHELEYEFRNRIQQALAASSQGWTAQEQCNAIINQAKYTEPMDLSVDTRPPPPPPPPAAAPAPPQGNTTGGKSQPTRTLLLLGIVLILVVAALVIVGTLPADTYEEN